MAPSIHSSVDTTRAEQLLAAEFNQTAGWDATVPITPATDDPFSHLTDDELLASNAGVLCAYVEAQANQRRLLDSAIIPDCDLVFRSKGGGGKFNELRVSTPSTAPMRYFAADGVEIVPPEPFYPGQQERHAPKKHRLFEGPEEHSGDPVAVCLANAVAVLQIGAETGRDVTQLAQVLSAAWGTPGLFTASTATGIMGTAEFKRLAAEASAGDARLLYSWQKTSAIRSGVLPMRASDYGPDVHVDYRRVRVVAENFFQLTQEVETLKSERPKAATIVYAVPPESALSCAPSTFYPASVMPMDVQVTPAYAKKQLDAAVAHGVLEFLWPQGFKERVATLGASAAGGLHLKPVEFTVPQPKGARIAAATQFERRIPLAAAGMSAVREDSKTLPRTLSAMLYKIGHETPNLVVITWHAKLACCISVARAMSATGGARMRRIRQDYIISAASRLLGPVPRALEVGLSDSAMALMNSGIPKALRGKVRSQVTVVRYLLWETSRLKETSTHTIIRGVLSVLKNARTMATSQQFVTPRKLVAEDGARWVATYLPIMRGYWRLNYEAPAAALRACAGSYGRQDLETAYAVAAALNKFRAEFMASMSVRDDDRDRAGQVSVLGCVLYFKPYHAAAELRASLQFLLAVALPEFGPSENITSWLYTLGDYIEEPMAAVKASLPRDVPLWGGHGANVLGVLERACRPSGLAEWAERSAEEAASDLKEVIVAGREAAKPAVATPATAATPDLQNAMAALVASFATPVPAFTVADEAVYRAAVADIPDDAWDDISIDATEGSETATTLLSSLRAATTKEGAASVVAAIIAAYSPDVTKTSARIG
jgi:hypothetical protein